MLPNWALINLVLVIWLLGLSFFLFRTTRRYSRLIKNAKGQDLKAVLEEILTKVDDSQRRIAELVLRCEKIENDGKIHVQKVGLLRFNPFKDTGGNQSFVLAVLDACDSGIVITNLHARGTSRWYAKSVKEGKGIEHELSTEEKEAIKIAQKTKK